MCSERWSAQWSISHTVFNCGLEQGEEVGRRGQQGRQGDTLYYWEESGEEGVGGRDTDSVSPETAQTVAGGQERGGHLQSAASLGWCCCSGRGDDAATLLGDGSAGGDHVVLQPGESPRSPAEGR